MRPNLLLSKNFFFVNNPYYKINRHIWDDDFKDGKVVEILDENTDLYRYVITCMPPHASRDFFEIR